MTFSLGVDIGGTKVAAGLVDRQGNCRHFTAVPSIPEDEEAMFEQVSTCVRRVLEASGVPPSRLTGIGVGVPGKVDREQGLAVVQNNLPWRNFPLAERLRSRFSANVILDNDVCMAAYGEWAMRGRKREETFVFFTVSTGIACCTIHRGDVLRGAGFAGEVGLIPFSGGSRLEEAAAGPAIGRLPQGKPTTARRVIEDYRRGDPVARERMEEVIREWAAGLYAVICLVDPHRVVLGGGVIHHHPFLLEEIRKKLAPLLIPAQKEALDRLFLSALGEKAGCVGAGIRLFL